MTKGKTATKRVKVAIYFDPEQKVGLEKLSEQTRVPWSEYVREGVGLVLAKYRKQRKGGAK